MLRSISALATSFLIASCASSPEPVEPGRILVERDVPVFPPEEYLDECVIPRESAEIEAELRRQAALVRCERSDKAAIRTWIEERRDDS
jgi:hypothetical protein